MGDNLQIEKDILEVIRLLEKLTDEQYFEAIKEYNWSSYSPSEKVQESLRSLESKIETGRRYRETLIRELKNKYVVKLSSK